MMSKIKNRVRFSVAIILLLVIGLLGFLWIKATSILMLIMVLMFFIPLLIVLIKFRLNPKIALRIIGYFLLVIVLTAFLILSLSGRRYLYGKSGAWHINVMFPEEAVAHWDPPPDYFGRIIHVFDAHPSSSGNMVFSVILPDSTEVFVTKDGELALRSLLMQEQEQIAGGKTWRMIFDVHEDSFRDKLRWAYILWRGSAAGHPEAARGNPKEQPTRE